MSSATIPLALRLVQARTLADADRPDEAERILAPNANALPDDPLAVHTLAVIVTKRGDYPRARRLWQHLARLQPGQPEAPEMIEAIDNWVARPAWVRFAPPVAAVLAVVLVTVLIFSRRSHSAPTAAVPARVAPVTTPYAVSAPVTAPVAARPVAAGISSTAVRPSAVAPTPVVTAEPLPMITFEVKPTPKPTAKKR